MRIAIIGSGISGSLIARMLCTDHEVHVFEANDYVGGHTHTSRVEAWGRSYSVDTGFMVFNERTYPNFTRLLSLLGVASQESDMSFSVRCDASGTEYQGSSLNGLFAQRSNLFRPRFYGMLSDIFRFNRRATAMLENNELNDGQTVGQLLSECRVGPLFVSHYLLPMTGAIWSTRPERMLDFPAKFLCGFLRNHGLLQINDRPQWKTIVGGAKSYMDALTAPLRSRIRLSSPVSGVRRLVDRVLVTTAEGGEDSFEAIIFASHADQTLRMLGDASSAERDVLSAFPYQTNTAVLHTDKSLMPRRRRAWASWNYQIPSDRHDAVSVTYDVDRLQRLGAPDPILLTLNDRNTVNEQLVLRRFTYDHPAYSCRSIAAQERIGELNGVNRTYFCGAYCGYGFHEDGVNSALAVADYFGKNLESCKVVSTKDESRIAATVR